MDSYSYNYGNRKTGAMLTVRGPQKTCPDNCGLKGNGCYAENAPMVWAWGRDSKPFRHILQEINRVPPGGAWRLWEAGDFPHVEGNITLAYLRQLIEANRKRKGFGYTHHQMIGNPHNQSMVKIANARGLTINLSSDNPAQADMLCDLGIAPVVTLLREGTPKVSFTPKGRKIVRCPAENTQRITCSNCLICAKADRTYLVGFTVHGARRKTAAKLIPTFTEPPQAQVVFP